MNHSLSLPQSGRLRSVMFRRLRAARAPLAAHLILIFLSVSLALFFSPPPLTLSTEIERLIVGYCGFCVSGLGTKGSSWH